MRPLILACFQDQLPVVEFLAGVGAELGGADPQFGIPLLDWACCYCDGEVAAFLRKRGQ